MISKYKPTITFLKGLVAFIIAQAVQSVAEQGFDLQQFINSFAIGLLTGGINFAKFNLNGKSSSSKPD